MEKKFIILVLSLFSLKVASAQRPDSLLSILDRTIERREEFTRLREQNIETLKQKKRNVRTPDELYDLNAQILHAYESFVHDSTERYVVQNIGMARATGRTEQFWESNLQLAFIYSLSGLFVQAHEIFRSMDYARLPAYLKAIYCWNIIRYYENLAKYTDDREFNIGYTAQINRWRDSVITLLPVGSDVYLKERAFALQAAGDYNGALEILIAQFEKQNPDTHEYAMAAASLAKVYRLTGERELENKFLKIAAITDLRFAVKENEALLILALNLFEDGDIKRSYNYISVALSDANFYNSRFRNTVIARVQPVIESNYLSRIDRQRRNLIFSVVLVSIFGVGLVVALSIVFRQTRIVTKARRHLRDMNGELIELNRRLSEANIVKEKYIGYFMSRCVTYIDKLDTYRKDVNRKMKSGQIDRIYKPSDKELEKEIEELYENFDEAFLRLYPNFVDEFNSLLIPEARWALAGGRLNTELRIFAVMRLGITNINQIAEFLHLSQQTVYNYKSKVRSRVKEACNLEEEVQKLCLFVPRRDSI